MACLTYCVFFSILFYKDAVFGPMKMCLFCITLLPEKWQSFNAGDGKNKKKKEQLTKSQKRRMWDKGEADQLNDAKVGRISWVMQRWGGSVEWYKGEAVHLSDEKVRRISWVMQRLGWSVEWFKGCVESWIGTYLVCTKLCTVHINFLELFSTRHTFVVFCNSRSIFYS